MTLATVIAAGPCYPGWAKADKKARAKIVWTEYNKSSKGEVDPNVRKGTTPEILAKQYAKMQKQYQTATSTHSKSGGANLLDGRGQFTTQMYRHLRDSKQHAQETRSKRAPNSVNWEATLTPMSCNMSRPAMTLIYTV